MIIIIIIIIIINEDNHLLLHLERTAKFYKLNPTYHSHRLFLMQSVFIYIIQGRNKMYCENVERDDSLLQFHCHITLLRFCVNS